MLPLLSDFECFVLRVLLLQISWDNTTRIPIFFTKNFGKKNPFWSNVKKTSQSFWTSHFELVHCDWAMYFLTKPKLAFLTNHFDWYF